MSSRSPLFKRINHCFLELKLLFVAIDASVQITVVRLNFTAHEERLVSLPHKNAMVQSTVMMRLMKQIAVS